MRLMMMWRQRIEFHHRLRLYWRRNLHIDILHALKERKGQLSSELKCVGIVRFYPAKEQER